jgi:pimeloyl-ACP methyl ester carboxylesterase
MNLLKTPSFDLAVYAQGGPSSDKLALVLPGRLDTKDYAHMRSHVDFLASLGFYALSFDPPGTWESPGNISLYTTTNILKAVDEVIAVLGNKPTFLVGHSRGGSNAMLAGTKNPYVTRIAAIMSPAGPTTVELPKDGATVSLSERDLPPGTERTAKKHAFALPISYFEDQAQYTAVEALGTCNKPKLFCYGTEYPLVSRANVMQVYEAAAEPKMLHELHSGHDYRLQPEIIAEVNETIRQFLAEYP